MNEFLASSQALTFGSILLGISAVLVFIVLLLPSNRLPIERRRFNPDEADAGITKLADRVTDLVGRFLGARADGPNEMLVEAGISMPLKEIVVIIGAGSLAGFAFGLVVGQLLLAIVLALVVPVLGRMVFSVLAERRRKKFESQLGETLQMLAGSLRAGYSLPQAIGTVAQEGEEPTSSEFTRVTNEVRVGRALTESLDDVAVRMRNEDFYWVTQAIGINREVGGNLAEVLDNVSATIRGRAEIKRQVAALAADGKLSAIILMLLPFAVSLFLTILSPAYIGRLVAGPAGWMMIGTGAVMLTIGGFWLSKLINIKF